MKTLYLLAVIFADIIVHSVLSLHLTCDPSVSFNLSFPLVNVNLCTTKPISLTARPVYIKIIDREKSAPTNYIFCSVKVANTILTCPDYLSVVVSTSIMEEVLVFDYEGCKALHNKGYFYYKGTKVQIDPKKEFQIISMTTSGLITKTACKTELTTLDAHKGSRLMTSEFTIKIGRGSGEVDNQYLHLGKSVFCEKEHETCLTKRLGQVFWSYIGSSCPLATNLVLYSGHAILYKDDHRAGRVYNIISGKFTYQIQTPELSELNCLGDSFNTGKLSIYEVPDPTDTLVPSMDEAEERVLLNKFDSSELIKSNFVYSRYPIRLD